MSDGGGALVFIGRPELWDTLCQEHDWVAILLEAQHGTDVRVEAWEDDLPLARVFKNSLEKKIKYKKIFYG